MLLSDSPIVAELLAGVGYGHILVDHEHCPTDIRSGQLLLQAIRSASGSGTEPIVRVPGPNDPVYIKKALDSLRLPGGILVPMVDDVETARAVVRATRYPRQNDAGDLSEMSPLDYGMRGCAVPFVRASGWGLQSSQNYLKQCDNDLLVMVQVETPRGVSNIAEIAAVDGIDAIFLGPMDLSASVGRLGQFEHVNVSQLIRQAEQSVLDANTTRGGNNQCLLAGFRSPGRSLKEMYEVGYSLVCGSVDVGLLRDAAIRDYNEGHNAMRQGV
jgi:2-keto-3-deoxy-L-rhamnonate aldolase RhmA